MFDELFGKEEKKQKSTSVNFDELIEKVKKMPFQEGQILLWKETFNLEKWHFITKPLVNLDNPKPFIGVVEGKGWMYLFTDGKHALKFGKVQGLLNNDGSINTIAMKPKKAVELLDKFAKLGVFGVRFNQGEFGWYAPIENLKPMMDYLKI